MQFADVFEQSRKLSLQNDIPNPCQNFSNPGLSWDAMLIKINAELKLMINVNMYPFTRKGMEDGLAYIAKRYSKTY